jgi:hypothetical protein
MEQPATDIATVPTDDSGAGGRSARRAAHLTAAAGTIHAILFLVSFWLISRTPGPRSSDATLTAFYESGRQRLLIVVGLYLMPFAGIAFIWFIVALRLWLSSVGRRENLLLSNVQLVSGILFVALFFATASAYAASATAVEFASATVSPAVARQLPLYGSTLMFVFAMRMAAMFVFTTTNLGRGAGVLPRWFILVSFALGLFLLLSATLSFWLALVFPAWVLALCTLILLQTRGIPSGAVRPARAQAPSVPS